MDWFEKLVGFKETSYAETRENLYVEGNELVSRVNGARYKIGTLDFISLKELRQKGLSMPKRGSKLKLSVVNGDVRQMHRDPLNSGALFQVASQFNLLEMISPEITPEDGVTRYENDRTQGPACAIAAGAATIYRNYFASIKGENGQTEDRQLNGLEDLGINLSSATKLPINDLWVMRNGYALASQRGLEAISEYLKALTTDAIDILRGKLRLGIHWDVEVTDIEGAARPEVSQIFCSALPLAYSNVDTQYWEPLAQLVLDAAYEATLLAAVLNAKRNGTNIVFLTLLGGGAFGNEDNWIYSALKQSFKLIRGFDLDVRLVSYERPSEQMISLAKDFK
jgi:hypothetical protein